MLVEETYISPATSNFVGRGVSLRATVFYIGAWGNSYCGHWCVVGDFSSTLVSLTPGNWGSVL